VLIRPYGRRLTELLEYAAPLLFLDLIMVKKFVGVPPTEIIRSGGYCIPRDSLTGLAIRPTWKIPTLHKLSWKSPVQLTRALPMAAPSSREITLTIIGALIVYDFFFFLPHIAMHKVSAAPASGMGLRLR
jgi:cholesterol 25-hydroxylase